MHRNPFAFVKWVYGMLFLFMIPTSRVPKCKNPNADAVLKPGVTCFSSRQLGSAWSLLHWGKQSFRCCFFAVVYAVWRQLACQLHVVLSSATQLFSEVSSHLPKGEAVSWRMTTWAFAYCVQLHCIVTLRI